MQIRLAILVVITLTLLTVSIWFEAIPLYVPLLAGSLYSAWMAWSQQQKSVREILHSALTGVVETKKLVGIFLLIGALIPSWSLSGVIDSMVYHGTSFITPPFLILFAFNLSLIVSMLLGTSVGSMSTVGVAVIGLAHAYQMPIGPVAGALVSGAFIGDRTSPLSGSAHLAATMTGTSFFHGWKVLVKSIIPVVILCILLYAGLGFIYGDISFHSSDRIEVRQRLLEPFDFFSIWLWLPPLSVLLCALVRVPVLYNLAQAILLSAMIGIIQYQIPVSFLLHSIWTGVERQGSTIGGIWPMIQALWVIMSAGIFYGTMQSARILDQVGQFLTEGAKTPGQLMRRTGLFSLGISLLTCNQTLCLMIPGKLMRCPYQRIGLTSSHLLRTISDTGMVISGWIPWNLNAILCASAIGVSVVKYMPFAYLLFLLPLFFFWQTHSEDHGPTDSPSTSDLHKIPI